MGIHASRKQNLSFAIYHLSFAIEKWQEAFCKSKRAALFSSLSIEHGRRERHHCLHDCDHGFRHCEDGVHHADHFLDSSDHGFCEREDLLSQKDHFPDPAKIFSSFETMDFVSNPMVPDTKTMRITTKTMVEDDHEIIEKFDFAASVHFYHSVCRSDHGVYPSYHAVGCFYHGVCLFAHGVGLSDHCLYRFTHGVGLSDKGVFRFNYALCLFGLGLRLFDHDLWHQEDVLGPRDHLLKAGDRGRRSGDHVPSRR